MTARKICKNIFGVTIAFCGNYIIIVHRYTIHRISRYKKRGGFMAINKELSKGSTVILILTLLDQRPMYGYEMIKEIEDRSSGVFTFKEGTLYPILHTLENENMVEAYWVDTDGGRKRKYYRITKQGRLHLKEKQEEWKTFRTAVDKVLWERIVWG